MTVFWLHGYLCCHSDLAIYRSIHFLLRFMSGYWRDLCLRVDVKTTWQKNANVRADSVASSVPLGPLFKIKSHKHCFSFALNIAFDKKKINGKPCSHSRELSPYRGGGARVPWGPWELYRWGRRVEIRPIAALGPPGWGVGTGPITKQRKKNPWLWKPE